VAFSPMQTDTAAQAAVGNQISETSAATRGTLGAIEGTVQGLQGQFVGAAGSATQAKAQHLNEAGIALANELNIVGEKVNTASGGTANADESGSGIISASAGAAF
jgi:uncharacterized protein YukE